LILNSAKEAKGELVFTSFLFALSIVVLVDTINLTESNVVGFVGPKVFPFAIGIALFVLSGLQIVSVLRGERGTPEGVEGGQQVEKPVWRPFIQVVIAVIAYAALIDLLGFLRLGPVLFFTIAHALGATKKLKLAIVSIVLAVVVFFGFTQGLRLYLPLGFDFINQVDPSVEEDSGETW
jgi:putative tricarboxylic transport membrane protein